MTAAALAEAMGLTVFCPGREREVTSGWCGDLLSKVLASAPKGCAWLTVMTHVSVAAVAVLRDAACVILTQGARPDAALLARAQSEGLPLFGTDDDAFTASVRLGKQIGR